MADILSSPLHQEQFPAEIDVYKIPHNRMKQLVSSITEALPEIQVGCIAKDIYKSINNISWVVSGWLLIGVNNKLLTTAFVHYRTR